jgi:hypothetical protein
MDTTTPIETSQERRQTSELLRSLWLRWRAIGLSCLSLSLSLVGITLCLLFPLICGK